MDTKKKITERPKVDSLKSWIEAKPYWEQYLWSLHLTKEELTDADLEKCYQYLLEDSGVVKIASDRKKIALPVLDFENTDSIGSKITLDKIENLKAVNALDEGCIIEFGKNLTIIYGDNGAGKSGIGRLLSNACHSRKPRQLLNKKRFFKMLFGQTVPKNVFHVINIIRWQRKD